MFWRTAAVAAGTAAAAMEAEGMAAEGMAVEDTAEGFTAEVFMAAEATTAVAEDFLMVAAEVASRVAEASPDTVAQPVATLLHGTFPAVSLADRALPLAE